MGREKRTSMLNDAPVLEDHSTKYIEKVANNLGCLTDESERSPAETTSEISTTKHTIAGLYSFVKDYDELNIAPGP